MKRQIQDLIIRVETEFTYKFMTPRNEKCLNIKLDSKNFISILNFKFPSMLALYLSVTA